MSTQPTPQRLDFAPLHRTTELENIHAQVIENDLQSSQQQQQQSSPATRKVLTKHLTVIGDGSDIDTSQIKTRQ